MFQSPMIDLLKKDKEEEKLSYPIIDMIGKEEQETSSPMINKLKESQFLQTGTTIPSQQPKQPIQDIAKISPETVQAPSEPVMGTAGYVGGKVYNILIEKPVFAMAAPISSGLEKTFRALGFTGLADRQSEVTAFYSNPPVGENVQQHIAYLREQAYSKGMLQGVGFDIVESVTQLAGLLIQMAATRKLPAFSGKDIYTHFGAMATHAITTTPGDIGDRVQAALYRIGYSMTPFIANATGATGLTAVAVDTALNTFLTSPTYKKVLEEAKTPEEFFQMAIPQLVMDIGMAWNTRGLPANQRQAELNKFLKAENRFIKLNIDEFNKIVEQFDKDFQTKQEEGTRQLNLERTEKLETEAKSESKTEVEKPVEIPKGAPISEIEQWGFTDPTTQRIHDFTKKVIDALDTELPFKRAGASETGFRFKNYFSEIEAGLTKGQELGFKITEISRKNNISPNDLLEATFATESNTYFLKMNPEQRAKIEPIIKEVKSFYKDWEGKLKDIGWMEEPFPQSLISRNNKNIETYQEQLKAEGISVEEKASIQKSIADLKDQNQKIKDLDLSFVSVPIRMIMEGADTAISKHFMSILPHWGRKTITIKDLVETGVLKPEQADIRNIVAEYSDRMSRKYALGQIFKAAESDGLVAKASDEPEWATFTAKVVPQLKGKVVHPVFNDMLNAYFGAQGGSSGIAKAYESVVGITKMMQFYNPAFLPMYDVLQGFAAGTFTSKNTPKNILKALKDVPMTLGGKHKNASVDYMEALENGLFSTPFTIPSDKYQQEFNNMIHFNIVKILGDKIKNPIMAAYQLSWNTAWKGDQIVRMITYNHLKDKGMTSREAAQIAAKFHGDYASVPPATRRVLNKVFFTPTFKITMGKLYGEMFKGAAKTIFTPKTVESKDKTYAKGLIMAAAALQGAEFFFNNILGYETEQKFRRYVKEVETDEGMKDSVITISNPFNIPWRYYYRGKGAIDDPELNKVQNLWNQAKYELTPVLKVGFDFLENRYENVYKFGDDPERQIVSAARYITTELVKITQPFAEAYSEPDEFKTKSAKVFQKELGTVMSKILTPFVFHYVRDIEDVRIKKDLYNLEMNYRKALYSADSPKQLQRIIQNFNKDQEKLLKKLDDYLNK